VRGPKPVPPVAQVRSSTGGRVETMSGMTCLVTGATSGIGRETALQLAMLGATVIITGRDAARGAAAAAEITRRAPRARVEVTTLVTQ
jgi:NAD(P)-dependent dehydrogenase (short-subunit alcohol dehydrogenase family)